MAPGTRPPAPHGLARTTAETDHAEPGAAGIDTAGTDAVEAEVAGSAPAGPQVLPDDWSVAPRVLLHRTPARGRATGRMSPTAVRSARPDGLP